MSQVFSSMVKRSLSGVRVPGRKERRASAALGQHRKRIWGMKLLT